MNQPTQLHVKNSINEKPGEFVVQRLDTQGGSILSDGVNHFQADTTTARSVEEYQRTSGISVAGNVKTIITPDTQVNHLINQEGQSRQFTTSSVGIARAQQESETKAVIYGEKGTNLQVQHRQGDIHTTSPNARATIKESTHQYELVLPLIDQPTRQQIAGNIAWATEILKPTSPARSTFFSPPAEPRLPPVHEKTRTTQGEPAHARPEPQRLNESSSSESDVLERKANEILSEKLEEDFFVTEHQGSSRLSQPESPRNESKWMRFVEEAEEVSDEILSVQPAFVAGLTAPYYYLSGKEFASTAHMTTAEKAAFYAGEILGVGSTMLGGEIGALVSAETNNLWRLGVRTYKAISPITETVANMGHALSRWGVFGRNPDNQNRIFSTGGRVLETINAINKADKLAAEIYEIIRSSDNADVELISKNTGMLPFQILRIKQHLFFNEHELFGGRGRFTPDIEIVDAWFRLQNGNFVEQDIKLLQHEYYESRFESIFGTDYITAHRAANDSKRKWDPNEFVTTPEMTWRK